MSDIRETEKEMGAGTRWWESGGLWVAVVTGLVMLWFYAFELRYGSGRDLSAFAWLKSAWNAENDFEHGFMMPLIVVGLIAHRRKELRLAVGEGSYWGIAAIVVGGLLYAAAYRTFQPRVAIGALPILLWGASWYLWGWRVAKGVFLPLFFFWLAIPMPSFQHATVKLQLLATELAHHGAALFGVKTVVQGNMIASAKGLWEPLEIAKGCSGIRSLMALLMITGAWTCMAKLAWWKRGILFASALPLAIIGNTVRVVSIFVFAEYYDAKWATGTWHDWCGLLLCFPLSLFLLLVLHSILEGGVPWKQRRVVRRVVVNRGESVTSKQNDQEGGKES